MSREDSVSDSVLSSLFAGSVSKCAPPTRIVSVFVSSDKEEFILERERLVSVFSSLSLHFSRDGVQIELFDPHLSFTFDPALDPEFYQTQLNTIKQYEKHSLGCFFLCLLGGNSNPCSIPSSVDVNKFTFLHDNVKNHKDAHLLDQWFHFDEKLQQYLFQAREAISDEDAASLLSLSHLLQEVDKDAFPSVVESQLDYAISLSSGKMLAVAKTDGNETPNKLENKLNLLDSTGNLIKMSSYSMDQFEDTIYERIKSMIQSDLLNLPSPRDLGPTYYDIYLEASTHLYHSVHVSSSSFDLIDHFPFSSIDSYFLSPASFPFILTGGDGCGKTNLISHLVTRISTLFPHQNAVVVVRHLGLTPRSMYLSELVRSLCFQISFALGFEVEPKHFSFHLTRLFTWFQSLLRTIATLPSTQLVILLDDLHLLKLPPNTQGQSPNGALAWLPTQMPSNVHLLCTVTYNPPSTSVGGGSISGGTVPPSGSLAGSSSESRPSSANLIGGCGVATNFDRVLGSWKSELNDKIVEIGWLDENKLTRFLRCLGDCQKMVLGNEINSIRRLCVGRSLYFCRILMELASNHPESCKFKENVTLATLVSTYLDLVESKLGLSNVSSVAKYLTCARYGVTEHELLSVLKVNTKQTTIWSPLLLHRVLQSLDLFLSRKLTDNRVLLSWKHRCLIEIIRSRYFPTAKSKRVVHAEMASWLQANNCLSANEWSGVRLLDEFWFHLLHTGDVSRIKQCAMCNFRFLQSSVESASICYVISVFELVRTQILDFEIELVYHTLRQCTDILSKDRRQLASELVSWLRPFADETVEHVQCLVSNSEAWLEGDVGAPVLAAISSWLWTPLPQLTLTLSTSLPISSLTVTHDAQYVICTQDKLIHMYHVASKQLVRTFTGHRDQVLCLHLEKCGQYLVSGSADTTVIVWDLIGATPYRTFSEHFASVTCVTTTQSEVLVISGSDDGRVLVVRLSSGDLIHKLEHHRGCIVAVAVTDSEDVLVTGSSDCTVCVWSLDSCCLLNTIRLPNPVLHLSLSSNAIFLLVSCDDNNLYLRSLATGSEIHVIRGRDIPVTQMQIAADNCRVAVSYEDNTVKIFDIHTTKCLNTITCSNSPVTSLKISYDDSFLFTSSGTDVEVWYFNRTPQAHTDQNQLNIAHTDHVTCTDISQDGSLVISGSKDRVVKVWNVHPCELHSTLEGHSANITCVALAPNSLYAVSGSEDKTVRVWGLTLGLVVCEFKEHQWKISGVKVLMDSRRILSCDVGGILKLWQADTGVVYLSCLGPTSYIDVTNNMRFAICGSGDNNLRIWTLSREDHKYSVSHSDIILCHALTPDSRFVITGSRDASLKIWDINTGRLTQVLVGHSGPVTCACVAPSPLCHRVFSGSHDATLMIWDQSTGHEVHSLVGHCGPITCVKVTADGKTLVSGSRDMTIRVWCCDTGFVLSSLDLHVPVITFVISFDASHLAVILENCIHLALVSLHNRPTVTFCPRPAIDDINIRPDAFTSKRSPLRRRLQKEMSLDSYTWQKRYSGIISKRSSTISLEDFRALSAAVVSGVTGSTEAKGVASGGIAPGSGGSSLSSSSSDVRSVHSADSMQIPIAVAMATTEVVGVLNAVHSSLGGKEEVGKVESHDEVEAKDLDVAPWEAEEIRVGRSGGSRDNYGIHNSEVCSVM